MVNAKIRCAIEDHAMQQAVKHFESLGYDVENISKRESCDLKCLKGNETVFVEVKGTQTEGAQILLTPKEVAFARDHSPNTALFSVYGIEVVDGHDAPIAFGGKVQLLRPWYPKDSKLKPLCFSCRVP